MKTLNALLSRLDERGLLLEQRGPAEERAVDGVTNDSRTAGPGTLFVAIRGERIDGHAYIARAVEQGASAVVCEDVPDEVAARHPGVLFARVPSSRAALAELGGAFYDDPSRGLTMVGITGTNGKTTTAFLVHHLLTVLGRRAGLIGTVEVRIGDEIEASSLTTPDALELHRLFRRMADAGCTACVMEVSSHALEQERVRAVAFDAAVFTNLTQDHLDYHPTFAHYLQAKKRLFDGLGPAAAALYNEDDPSGRAMVADTAGRITSYGRSPGAEIRLEILANEIRGLRLRIDGRERTFRLVGAFNAYNLTAAYGVGRALGFGADEVLDALASAPPVPGRFEQIAGPQGTTAIVDYAHTPDALENVLRAIHETKSPDVAVWCVFGCGGDRDATKRGPMGRIAERYADYVLVTSDNPRTEDPEAILHDIRAGMERPEAARWVVDRREAIRTAILDARPGDVVLVAGKGHETYQIIGTERLPFDDREEITAHFQTRAAMVA